LRLKERRRRRNKGFPDFSEKYELLKNVLRKRGVFCREVCVFSPPVLSFFHRFPISNHRKTEVVMLGKSVLTLSFLVLAPVLAFAYETGEAHSFHLNETIALLLLAVISFVCFLILRNRKKLQY